jgi:beta-lactamase regulating signal transducer with metallopeptidase domain
MSSFQAFVLVVLGQVTVISAAAVLLMLLSRDNAARRHSIGFVGLVLVLCSPLMAGILPTPVWQHWHAPANAPNSSLVVSAPLPRTPVAPERRSPETDTKVLVGAAVLTDSRAQQDAEKTTISGSSRDAVEAIDHSASSFGWSRISLDGALNLAGVVWLAGSVVLMSRWLWQSWRLRWLMRSLSVHCESQGSVCEAVKDDVCRALTLRDLPPIIVSDLIPMAMVLGIWRPRIVLPRELVECREATRLRDVLIHECAHIVRGDLWVNLAQRLASTFWWWHPGVIGLNAQLAQSREEVCDNFVLRHGDAPGYAQTLLELSELCTSRRDYATAIGLFGSRWTLESRIIGLLKPERNTMTTTKRRTVVLIAALLGAMCLLVGGVRGVDQPPPKSNAKQQPDGAVQKPAAEEKDKDKVTPPAKAIVEQKVKLRTITGRVVDDKDLPIAGAQLWWVVSHGTEGVVVKGVSDEQGRFSLSTPDVAPRLSSWVNNTLWVLHKEKQLASAPASSPLERDGKPPELLIRLQAATDTSFVVKSPDQKPVAGVIVEPWLFRTHLAFDMIPEEARKIMSSTTDAEGRVRMPNMPRKGFHSVRTSSDSFGTQEFRLDGNPNPPVERTIELRATGSIEGQLRASNPAWIRGVKLWFSTDDGFRTAEGHAEVKTNDEGQFTVLKIAAGRLRVGVGLQPKDTPALPRFPDQVSLKEGTTGKLTIALEEPVVVRGTIRADDTDKPIPGAEIHVGYGSALQGEFVISDAEGHYEARVLPGPVHTQVVARSEEFSNYEQTGSPWENRIEVPSQAAPFDLPPIRLISTIPLKGKIIDQDGRPVAKARFYGVKGNRRYAFAKTNEMGEFSAQLPKTITLEGYQIWLDDESGPKALTVEKADPLIFRVTLPRP